jgi:peroxiredoxin-like protein
MSKIVTSAATATWRGAFDGAGEVRSGGVFARISLPTGFGGRGEDATPEDLFLAALGSCYLITLGIILEKGQIPYESLTLEAELRTEALPPAAIKEAVLRPRVVSGADRAALAGACVKAEQVCLVSRACAGNVAKTLLPEFV